MRKLTHDESQQVQGGCGECSKRKAEGHYEDTLILGLLIAIVIGMTIFRTPLR